MDVYTLGLVLYKILTRVRELFPNMSPEQRRDFVGSGETLKVTDITILKSKHVFDVTLLKAIDKCWIRNPKKRASAREIADLLHESLKQVE